MYAGSSAQPCLDSTLCPHIPQPPPGSPLQCPGTMGSCAGVGGMSPPHASSCSPGDEGDIGTLTDLVQAVIELVPQGPEDEAHLLPGAVAERMPVHIAAGEVDGAGIVLVLLHVVADPLQHLHLGPEVWELTEPLRLVCKGWTAGLRSRVAVPAPCITHGLPVAVGHQVQSHGDHAGPCSALLLSWGTATISWPLTPCWFWSRLSHWCCPALLLHSLCHLQGLPNDGPTGRVGSLAPGLYCQTALLVSPGSLAPGTCWGRKARSPLFPHMHLTCSKLLQLVPPRFSSSNLLANMPLGTLRHGEAVNPPQWDQDLAMLFQACCPASLLPFMLAFLCCHHHSHGPTCALCQGLAGGEAQP